MHPCAHPSKLAALLAAEALNLFACALPSTPSKAIVAVAIVMGPPRHAPPTPARALFGDRALRRGAPGV